MRKPIYAAFLLAGSAVALAACSETATDETPVESGAETIEGIEITNARLMLPPVAGNPAAIYFEVANSGDRNIAFRNAEVAKAGRAEVHDMMEYDFEMVMEQFFF